MRTVFCYLCLAVLFGCIFARVESWPFSDFAVFKNASRLESVVSYRLGFESEGQPTWLYTGEETNKNRQFYHLASQAKTHEQYQKLMEPHLETARRRASGRFSELILFKRSLKASGEDFEVQDDVLVRLSL